MDTARREVELGRRAGHPRLIRLLDSVVLSEPDHPFLDGALVLVMERARRSLRDLLHAGPVSEAEGARLITEICEGLAHLHRTGWGTATSNRTTSFSWRTAPSDSRTSVSPRS
ncbi:hypothetical protein ACFSNO_24220 [Streptomyces cirratus]